MQRVLIFVFIFELPEISCPGVSFYEECGTACAPSCADPTGSTQCEHDCINTCECPHGTLMSGDLCLKKTDCSCFLEELEEVLLVSTIKLHAWTSDVIKMFFASLS